MAIRGVKLTFSGGGNLGLQKLQGAQKLFKENPKKCGDLDLFFFRDSKKFVLCRVPI